MSTNNGDGLIEGDVKLCFVDPRTLRNALFNPAIRTSPTVMRALVADVAAHGVRVPIMVTHDMVVGDGHRRLAAALASEKELVPVLVHAPGITAEEIYSRQNLTRQPRSAEKLAAWLVAPESVTEFDRRFFATLEQTVGMELVHTMIAEGLGINAYRTAVHAINYCAREPKPETIRLVLSWIIRHRQTYALRKFFEGRKPPRRLWERIESDKPLIPAGRKPGMNK